MKCSGPAYGAKESSYRSEGYGILSPTRFLLHLFQYHQCEPKWNYQYSADNESILNKLIEDLKYDLPYPNTTLEPDWDIRQQIKETVLEIGRPHDFVHVRGHQDDKTPYDVLPFEAKLNVDADHEAVRFNTANPERRPLVPRLPCNRAQLLIQGETVTGHYRTALRYAALAPPLLSYMLRKFDWTPEARDSINWTAHSLAIGRLTHRRRQLIKLNFEILPTARRVSKYDGSSDLCPRCKAESETIDHVIRCSHEDAVQWRSNLLNSLRNTCIETLNTRFALIDVLIDGISIWFRGTTALDPTRYPPELETLIRDQNAIGWNQIFRGRMALQWSTLQQEHLSNCGNKDKKLSGNLWTTSIICLVWKDFFELWEARNQSVHGTDPASRRLSQKRQILDKLKELHQ